MIEKIQDITEMSEQHDADIKMLLLDAYARGHSAGMDKALKIALETLKANQ